MGRAAATGLIAAGLGLMACQPPLAGAPSVQGELQLRVWAAGGPGDCRPKAWIYNGTGEAVSGLLLELDWRDAGSGELLRGAGGFGLPVHGLSPGIEKPLLLPVLGRDCGELELALGTYACRDDSAARRPCPGPLQPRVEGTLKLSLDRLGEGSMRGAVER